MNTFSYKDGIFTEIDNIQLPFQLAYHTYGKLNADRSNAKWVFHALTANSDAQDWWSGLFGQNRILNPEEDFIICANMLGSCYGSTCPLSNKPNSEEKYYHDFPFLTMRDIVNSFRLLKEHLGIEKLKMGIGGSMGGSLLLEWNVMYPEDFENAVYVASSAQESSWGKAIHTVHKMAIEADPTWKNRDDKAGIQGLSAARGVGMLFYRTYKAFNETQIDDNNTIKDFKSDSYIRYQGKKLVNRFNAFSYYYLLNILDTHNVGRGFNTIEDALSRITAKSLIIGINSDILYPREEQQFLADHIPNNKIEFIDSEYGHDGFLIETEQINKFAVPFINEL